MLDHLDTILFAINEHNYECAIRNGNYIVEDIPMLSRVPDGLIDVMDGIFSCLYCLKNYGRIMEIERKWLIDKNNIPFNLNDYESFDINQAYISFSPTIRIRKIVNKNEYVLTIKSKSKNDISREEYEINISEKEYEELFQKKEGIVISKTRYKVPMDSYIFEIDIFHDDYEGLAYLEIEFDSIEEANAYSSPSWVIKEVTHDHMYSNSSLAKKKFIL